MAASAVAFVGCFGLHRFGAGCWLMGSIASARDGPDGLPLPRWPSVSFQRLFHGQTHGQARGSGRYFDGNPGLWVVHCLPDEVLRVELQVCAIPVRPFKECSDGSYLL